MSVSISRMPVPAHERRAIQPRCHPSCVRRAAICWYAARISRLARFRRTASPAGHEERPPRPLRHVPSNQQHMFPVLNNSLLKKLVDRLSGLQRLVPPGHASAAPYPETVSRTLAFARRRASTLRPALVRMRLRNPWTRRRRRL
jgi:hypothetical protein